MNLDRAVRVRRTVTADLSSFSFSGRSSSPYVGKNQQAASATWPPALPLASWARILVVAGRGVF